MEPGTGVEICIHRVPVQTNSPAPDKAIVNKFHEVLNRITEESVVNLTTTLENTLLDKALTHINYRI